MHTAKTILCLIVIACISLSFTACGKKQNDVPPYDPTTADKTYLEGSSIGGGQYHVEFAGSELIENPDGNILVVIYDFANSSGTEASAAVSTEIRAFQSGAELKRILLQDRKYSEACYAKVRDGASTRCEAAFRLNDAENVRIEACAPFYDKTEVVSVIYQPQTTNLTPTKKSEYRTSIVSDYPTHDEIIPGIHFNLTGVSEMKDGLLYIRVEITDKTNDPNFDYSPAYSSNAYQNGVTIPLIRKDTVSGPSYAYDADNNPESCFSEMDFVFRPETSDPVTLELVGEYTNDAIVISRTYSLS